MAGHSTPTATTGLAADEARRIGGTARGWPGLGRLLADRWGGEAPHQVVEFWMKAQAAKQLPLAIRVRAATAHEPWLR